MSTKMPTGITQRHSRRCPSRDGGDCPGDGRKGCAPSFSVWVYSAAERRKIRKTFPTLAAAKLWRADATVALSKGTMRAPTKLTLRQAAEEWSKGAKAGTIRTRSGDRYKPSALRGYETSLRLRILPKLGAYRLADVQRRQVQALADEMLAESCDPSTIRNALMPLRVIYRRALEDGDVAVNPTEGLRLPAVRGIRDRIASPEEAAALLEALPADLRALYATACYAGLRRGELMGLRWTDVDLAGGKIRIERSWDERAGEIEPKSKAGKRTVPIAAVLRDTLLEHRLQTRSEGLVFGATATRPFTPTNVRKVALTAWKRANKKRAEAELEPLVPLGLHACRHTFASLMIEAGVNAKALASYMGHSSITTTLDRYGHLFPGAEQESAALLDALLERANTAARLAQLDRA